MRRGSTPPPSPSASASPPLNPSAPTTSTCSRSPHQDGRPVPHPRPGRPRTHRLRRRPRHHRAPRHRRTQRADYQRDLSVSYTRLAALAELDGNAQEAQLWFERDLAIAEKLAVAEPARADYQIDVEISLMNTARYAGRDARARLERAASILRTLDEQGRLAPAERGRIDAVAAWLAALP